MCTRKCTGSCHYTCILSPLTAPVGHSHPPSFPRWGGCSHPNPTKLGSPICSPLWRKIWVLPLFMCPCCSLQPMDLHVGEEAPPPMRSHMHTTGVGPQLFHHGLTAHYPCVGWSWCPTGRWHLSGQG